jgi:outer membrane autotransporter protein
MRQLIGESMVNVLAAVESNAYKAQGVVFGRLDRIRENLGDNPVPPAAGQGGEANRVWVAGFGVITEAKNRNHVFGYDYDAHGISLGYDRNVYAVPGLRLGASAIFSKGEMDVNDRRTRADLGTTGFGVYASYLLQDGIFLDATAAYGTTEVDYESSQILSGVKSGAFDVDSWQFGLRTGAVLEIGSARFVPSVGVRYTKFKQRGWSEALSPGANSVANDFDGRNDNQVDIPFNLRINRTFDTASFMITPELRLGASFAVKKPDHALSVGFRGSDLRTEIRGVRAKTTTLTAGAGVKITSAGIWDAYVNYDLDAYDGYASHNISGGFGFNF